MPTVVLLLRPPPSGWLGGVSSVEPITVTLQGVEAKPAAVQVAESLTLTVMSVNGTLVNLTGVAVAQVVSSTTVPVCDKADVTA